MADLLNQINQLKSLPPGLHWFCDTCDSDNNAQDLGTILGEHPIIRNLKLRQDQACDCLKILGFNGEEAAAPQQDLTAKISAQLSKCTLCVVGYYRSRQPLVERLRHEYDEEEVVQLLQLIHGRDLNRITHGLDKATTILHRAEPAARHINILDVASQLSLFEILSCEAFLNDEAILKRYFDEPFKLVQTNRKLKITQYLPAATSFLFDDNHDRRSWATNVWSRYNSILTDEDFEFAIKDPLLRNMQYCSGTALKPGRLKRLWYGIGMIVDKLNNDLITHALRALEIDVFRLALDHLHYDDEGFRFLVQVIRKLLELAPKAFWDSMGAISPTTFLEQIFNNPRFDYSLETAQESEALESSSLWDMLAWIKPFMASLETVHQARACRSLCFQLLDRLQADRFPLHARLQCKKVGLATLTWTLRNCNKESPTLSHTSRVVAAEALEVASIYTKDAIIMSGLPREDEVQENCAEIGLNIVKLALALECKSLRTDQEALSQKKDLPDGYTSFSPAIWNSVVQYMDRGNIDVARAALGGINDLTGLEKFKINADEEHTKEKSGFNIKLSRLTHLVSQILERISDFSPNDLDTLFRGSDTAIALVASLYSSDVGLYEAGLNLIKSISSESGRREAIGHLLKTWFDTTLNAFSWAIRRITKNKTFASCPRMLRTSDDILDILCNTQYGLLRVRPLATLAETKALEHFWQHQWEGLKVIYEMTEDWSRAKAADGNFLKEFCRDTMEFSERFFDQYGVFANAMDSVNIIKQEDGDSKGQATGAGKVLLEQPARVMEVMAKWLRLRDSYLLEISVKLTIKVVARLTERSMKLEQKPRECLEYILNMRTNLQPHEKAELARALEDNFGDSIPLEGNDHRASGTPLNRSSERSVASNKSRIRTIDLDAWRSKSKTTDQVIEVSEDEFDDSGVLDKDLLSVSRSAELMKEMQSSIAARKKTQAAASSRKPEARERKATALPLRDSRDNKSAKSSIQSEADRQVFREKREKEREAKKKRDAETLALVKRRAGVGASTGEGSSLGNLGVKGKDHAPKVQGMMVSSGSESDSEDEIDQELFGEASKAAKMPNDSRFYMPNTASRAQMRGPVKKTRQIRSAKDMRARLAPDLTTLHRTILGWDFFHNGDFPPGSARDDYSLVTNTFRTPLEYQSTFEPLLVLEAWQGFLKSREEGGFKTFGVKVANRMTVDAFLEISTSIPLLEGKELGISEADIVLMSKSQSPSADANQPHCLARVFKINRKKNVMEVAYRANIGNDLVASMVPNATIFAVKVASMTPLEREYGALLGLQYFDLCDEIVRAKPSPLLEYSDKQLAPLVANYNINLAQAKAVKSAVDNDAFTLIQGPPGSGKTKTIVAVVGALLTGSFGDKGVPIARPNANNNTTTRTTNSVAAKKLLVCAPSNAAVDELVMRFKEGVKTTDGDLHKLSVIRLGRSDAINANVVDVALEELVNAKLNLSSAKKAGAENDIHKFMVTHKATSERLNVLRTVVDELKAKGKTVTSDQDHEFETLKRKKQQLSNQIDAARDNGDSTARNAELTRRRVQQEILDGAHVICATLSGSGHEMFQGLNIEFETVIIDEAAQSIELSALIPLKYGCSKCILVGDPKQLPPTVLSREAARFQYEQSLFVRMQGNHPNDVHLLDTQYRMHPEISAFPSSAFYDARLLDGIGMAKLRTRPWHQSKILGPYRFFDVQGQQQNAPRGHSLINLAEINVALSLYDRLTTDCKGYDFKGKIGIITPYKSQLRELRGQFSRRFGDSVLEAVEFNTTDAFQGRESEIIIFSCVRASFSRGIGFLSDIRRMNVGITRAKCSLWMLGNTQSLQQGEFWGRLIQDAKSRDRYTNGDLHDILSKPLLTLDSKDLAEIRSNSSVKTLPTASGTDHDIEMPDAPSIRHSFVASNEAMKPSSAGSMVVTDPSVYTSYPAGGSNGLDTNSNCHRCGSSAHFSHLCDNPKTVMQCTRCARKGHWTTSCTVGRCFTCGAFGHLEKTCTSDTPLSVKENQRVRKQEMEHQLRLRRTSETKREKQLGDHDKRVPTVKATVEDSLSRKPNRPNHATSQQMGEKRRRGSSPPILAPKGPKLAKHNANSIDGKRKRQLDDKSRQLLNLPNGYLSRDQLRNVTGQPGQPGQRYLSKKSTDPRKENSMHKTSNMPPPSPGATMPNNANKLITNGSDLGKAVAPPSSNIDLGSLPRPPPSSDIVGPPPPPKNVRLPKKKKQVDPFIRPKKRP